MRKISRIFGAVGVTVAMVVGLAMAASPAQASSNLILSVTSCTYCGEIGYAHFNADPNNYPGDALRACDLEADGWGVIAWMHDPNGPLLRTATTQGHNSPYCTGWQTGNLPEEKHVIITICAVHGTDTNFCRQGDAWA